MSQPPPIADRVTSRTGHSVLMEGCANQIFIVVSISMKAMTIPREYVLCIDFASEGTVCIQVYSPSHTIYLLFILATKDALVQQNLKAIIVNSLKRRFK